MAVAFVALTDDDLRAVGQLVDLARSPAEPTAGHHHGRHGPERCGQRGQQRGAGRRGELHPRGAPVGRHALEQADGGRRRDWEAGRAPCAPSRCRWPRRRRDLVDPSTSSAATVPTMSMMASCPPTSWKWTSLDRAAVQCGLHLGQPAKDGERARSPLGRAASVIRATMWRGCGQWRRRRRAPVPRAGYPAPERFFDLQLPSR
jgi:hypothetical protein